MRAPDLSALLRPGRLAHESGAAASVTAVDGDEVRLELPPQPGTCVQGLPKLVRTGVLTSYTRERDGRIVAYARSRDAATQLSALPRQPQTTEGSWTRRLWGFIWPDPSMVHPDYKNFRAWSLTGNLLGGTVGFLAASTLFTAQKTVFATGYSAAFAGLLNLGVTVGAGLVASVLARNVDVNPPKWGLVSNLIGVGNGVLSIGVLSLDPKVLVPLNLALTASNAAAGAIGGAAAVGVLNHLAKDNNQGAISFKNTIQDGFVNLAGQACAMYLLGPLALSPYTMIAALAPLQAFCCYKAMHSIHMQATDRRSMEVIADGLIDRETLVAPRPQSLREGLTGLFRRKRSAKSTRIDIAESPDAAVATSVANGGTRRTLYGLFSGERYLMAIQPRSEGLGEGKGGNRQGGGERIQLAFRKDTKIEDVVRAFTHACLVERILDSPLAAALGDAFRKDPSLVVELAMRALPKRLPNRDELEAKGWHTRIENLHLPCPEAMWNEVEVHRVRGVPLETLKQYMKSPPTDVAARVLRTRQVPTAAVA